MLLFDMFNPFNPLLALGLNVIKAMIESFELNDIFDPFNPFNLFLVSGADLSHAIIKLFELTIIVQCIQTVLWNDSV
jgi:hypothetical protein